MSNISPAIFFLYHGLTQPIYKFSSVLQILYLTFCNIWALLALKISKKTNELFCPLPYVFCLIITIESLYLPRTCVYTSACMHWIYFGGFIIWHFIIFGPIYLKIFKKTNDLIALCNMLIPHNYHRIFYIYRGPVCISMRVYTESILGIGSCINFLMFQALFLSFFLVYIW